MSFSQQFLVSPGQAANTFSQVGGAPRQRHVFLVRFVLHGQSVGQTSGRGNTAQYLTFAAKSIDRPKINTKVEELNEYNKKRQVFTGYKLEAVRAQFYDSADGAAQNMWTAYSRYYFGDFNPGASKSYNAYDATMPQFLDAAQTGFGFTARNGGADRTDPAAQFYFQRIELYHFYDNLYDRYDLTNPRITQFEPDDLDYENSSVALINATFAYENLQYYPQQPVNPDQFPEFVTGTFYGNALVVADPGFPTDSASDFFDVKQSNPFVGSLLPGPIGAGVFGNFRFGSKRSTGALGLFGNFAFGPQGTSLNLGVASRGNPALAAALSLGAGGDPLASSAPLFYNAQAASRGMNGALYDVMQGQAMVSTDYPPARNTITGGLLASAALNHGGAAFTRDGVVYNANVYGAINARQSGTAQYGYNVQTGPDGSSWGYTGPDGFMDPTGPENDGPYSGNQPAGIVGRYGITQEPLAPPEFGGP